MLDVMEKQKTILIADDDANILEVAGFALRKAGFAVVSARNGLHALDIFKTFHPDLIILDIMMPEMDGTDVCKYIRAHSHVPIIFLSSKDDEIDRILGLELGGDDYVTKPFSPRELVSRIKAIFRRMDQMTDSSINSIAIAEAGRILVHGKLKLDLDRCQAFWDDAELTMTATEIGIMRTLLGFPGKVYTRGELIDRAYDSATVVSDRTVDSHIRHIREKFKRLGAEPIETVHGIGYKICSCR
jgi:two-component system, OmpR family, response regulator